MSKQVDPDADSVQTINAISVSKPEILKRSGCLNQFITTVAICVLAALAATLCKKLLNESAIVNIVLVTLGVAIGCSSISAIGHLLMITMILVGKYKVVIKKVLSISYRNQYADRTPSSEKRLEFLNFKLTVSSIKAAEFKIGDSAVMVFIDGIKYPIVIENTKVFQEK